MVWSKSKLKTPERYHTVFTFNFEHIQKINLISFFLTLNMYLSVGHKIKPQNNLCVFEKLFIVAVTFYNLCLDQKLFVSEAVVQMRSVIRCS